VRWIGFSEDEGEGNRRRHGFEAAKAAFFTNVWRTMRSTVDAATSLTDKIDIVQPERL